MLASVAGVSADEVFSRLETTAKGLNESQAAQRLVKYGANEMLAAQAEGWVGRLWRAVRNPLV